MSPGRPAKGKSAKARGASTGRTLRIEAIEEGWTTSFWSYVRSDDKAVYGKIGLLRQDICNIYSFMTGRSIEIFMDRTNVGWGQQWANVIEDGINNTVFMMPVVTPGFFESAPCRTELLKFHSVSKRRGLDELILPIVMSGLDLVSIDSDDEVARIVADAQYYDFTETWPYERGGEKWCLAVQEIVRDLIEAEERTEDRLVEIAEGSSGPVGGLASSPGSDLDENDDEDAPGISELMEQIPTVVEEATSALTVATEELERLGAKVQESPLGRAGSSGNSDPRGFQVLVAQSANSFREEAVTFEAAAAHALDRVSAADELVAAMRQTFQGMQDKSFEQAFVGGMGNLDPVRQVEDQMDAMIVQIADLEKLSSVLRKTLRPARRGCRFLRDAAKLVADWNVQAVA